jgi:uroporphyrinogen decarboxylase
MNHDMNHRQRILAAIEHRPVDRIPTDIWATPEVQSRLQAYCGCKTFVEVWDYLGIDGIVGISPEYIGPKLPDLGPMRKIDEWGIVRKWQEYDTGGYWELDVHPLANAETSGDLDAYPWPRPTWYDYSVLRDKARQHPARAIIWGYIAIFFYHNLLRGLERSLMDLVLRPEFAAHLIRRIAETFFELHQAGFEAADGAVDIAQVTDDYGSQTNLLISRRMFDEFYRPWLERAVDLVKSHHIKVFHHDDGAIRDLIPDFIEMGIDVLNPIQWRCRGMEQAGLARDFGGRVCFHGGMDNQQTLPFGTIEEVRAEVEYNLSTLGGRGTGYILAPCHNIQPNTPIENIIAMYDTAHRLGRLPPIT